MNITKDGKNTGRTDVRSELESVNRFAKTELTEDEVFTFSVLLCDNEVDRDFERFGEETLAELRELFVGKTGICDHDWSSGNQKARIYRTELVTEPSRKTAAGTEYMYLKGYAYMLRTEANRELIAEINGGIKKETSVGCAVSESRCSICGEPAGSGSCAHEKGREYDGRLCYAELIGAVDAYEWSFVAVPAQRNAGVIKRFESCSSLAELAEKGGFSQELGRLKTMAELGEKYLGRMRAEVLRLGLICGRELYDALRESSAHMSEKELEALQKALEKRVREILPPDTQLPSGERRAKFDGGEYKI